LLQTNTSRIYCLVRGDNCQKKLSDTLKLAQLWKDDFSDRIIALSGDLTQPQFGLTKDQYSQLSETVNTVYHCGAVVNGIFDYTALKPANVDGTFFLTVSTDRNSKEPFPSFNFVLKND
jgi:thioester reductase-like protein